MSREMARSGSAVRHIVLFLLGVFTLPAAGQTSRWSENNARTWYEHQPWLVGSNYIPADAINQLEMWQPSTFNPAQIDKELGWAERIGMNTMRVFLHDLPWQGDPQAFTYRIDQFLQIADQCAARHANQGPMMSNGTATEKRYQWVYSWSHINLRGGLPTIFIFANSSGVRSFMPRFICMPSGQMALQFWQTTG
jgi:hypothetical protein